MKRVIITLVSALIIVGFIALVHQAYTNRRGAPVEGHHEKPKIVLHVPYHDEIIDFKNEAFTRSPWDRLEGVTLSLHYQVTITPWSSNLIPDLNVKAFHNGKTIYFKLAYPDSTKNDEISIATFSDGASVMFPLAKHDSVNPESIMMGFQGRVNIWHWRAVEDREYREAGREKRPVEEVRLPVADLLASGVGTLAPKKEQNVAGRGYKTEQGWEVIFSRCLAAANPDEDAAFPEGRKLFAAFAAWDGDKEDRGSRKSISDFIELIVERTP